MTFVQPAKSKLNAVLHGEEILKGTNLTDLQSSCEKYENDNIKVYAESNCLS